MKERNFLINGIDDFREQCTNAPFSASKVALVKIFTTDLTKEQSFLLMSELRQIFTDAHFIGASTNAVIFDGLPRESGTLVSLTYYEKCQVRTALINWKGRPPQEVANDILKRLEEAQGRFLHILGGGYCEMMYQIMEEMNESPLEFQVSGGLAGEVLTTGTAPYVFTEHGCLQTGIALTIISGERLHPYVGVNISHEPISSLHTLTKTDGSSIDTIDHVPAVEWVQDYLGITDVKDYVNWQNIVENDPLVWFTFILDGHEGASRFIKYEEANGKMSFYITNLPSGAQFTIGYTSPTRCVDECYHLCCDIVKRPIENLFVYSCIFRKTYLDNCAVWELAPFADYHICGAFMLGELATINRRHELLNGSCVMAGTAENEEYIIPDFDVFSSLHKIEDGNKDLLNFVLKKQAQAMSQKNQELLSRLEQQQSILQSHMTIDTHLGIDNLIKLQEDQRASGLDKLLLIQIENADLLIKYIGKDLYYMALKEVIGIFHDYIGQKHYTDFIHFYCVTYDMFAIASGSGTDQQMFLHISRKLYKHFQFVKTEEMRFPFLSRFAAVLNQRDMLETGLNALNVQKELQTSFILCDKEGAGTATPGEELQMIGVITRALEGGGVVPYYQGIYNNQTKKIERYESLMRLADGQTVYSPAQFMDTAKKYHLYSALSDRMIDQVLKDFRAVDCEVSINISALDINNQDFRNSLFDKLEAFPDPSRIIIEILEDEELRDLKLLSGFIQQLKEHHAQIAIDDFGSGYSNLLEIMNLNPDIIKIDGGIVRESDTRDMNRIVLEMISHMANRMNTSLVAEFVENEAVQREIDRLFINYSQGYLHAKPVPFSELRFPAIPKH